MNQLQLISATEQAEDFTPDDWETPDYLAQMLAGFVQNNDDEILEPSAGSGQIAQYLPRHTVCIESKKSRVEAGKKKAPHCEWIHKDFLDMYAPSPPGIFDLVIGNPPFSLAPEFLNRSLDLCSARGRVVFVLPCDTLHKPEAFLSKVKRKFKHEATPIVGRVAYLKNGTTVRGRQIYDSIFTFWPVR